MLPAILGATIGEDPVDADIVRVEERDHPVVEDVGRRQWRRPGALRSAWLRAPASGPTDPSRPSDHVKTSAPDEQWAPTMVSRAGGRCRPARTRKAYAISNLAEPDARTVARARYAAWQIRCQRPKQYVMYAAERRAPCPTRAIGHG